MYVQIKFCHQLFVYLLPFLCSFLPLFCWLFGVVRVQKLYISVVEMVYHHPNDMINSDTRQSNVLEIRFTIQCVL